ncbi:MAG: RNA-binding protein [Clostridia bacterium]|nr:RNA-binding protein [Clostridia bacterium]
MNKNEIAAKFTSDSDERLALCRVQDKYNACRNGGYMTSTGFLSDRLQILAQRMLNHLGVTDREYIFDGGFSTASRRVLVFLPDYLSHEDAQSEDISTLRFIRASYYKEYQLTHRDFLGALMGDGISRDAVGDILVDEAQRRADIIVTEGIVDYMLNSFFSAGRARLETLEIQRGELCVPEQKTVIVKDTVASLRLDGIISAALGMSREKASGAVEKGLVELNHFPCQKGEKLLSEGDNITVRGFGKFTLSTVGSFSKKGRIFIEITRFV